MSSDPTAAARAFLDRAGTRVLLVTTDRRGAPHPWFPRHVAQGPDGTLLYLVVEEASDANKTMVNAIWFDRPVSVLLLGGDGQSLAVRGRVARNHFTGPLFLEHYLRLRDTTGEDLASVWEITLDEVYDPGAREGREAVAGSYDTLHFDTIARAAAEPAAP